SPGPAPAPIAPASAPVLRARRPAARSEARITPPPPASLREQRGYAHADLFAIAEIGYHYLMNGALDLASTVFEGLYAIAPDESYFALALGLVRDREGDKQGALACYGRAAALDPRDPRPDVNRAEIAIERGDLGEARRLLESARAKAVGVGDERLETKASALLRHLAALAPMQGRVVDVTPHTPGRAIALREPARTAARVGGGAR
ncbi:hypothetical protein L6R52_37450, partial [Myxococcota bacterium]|nr:hypothetical protein [Myxococcota bacterium]